MLFAYAFAAKVGCGLVGEIGAMKVNDELDAYESEGVSVQRFIVGTRLAAALLYTPIATAVSAVAITFGAWLNSVVVIKAVPSETFFRYNWGNQAVGDQFFALAVCFLLATTVTLVSCFYGVRSTGGPAGVGRAVARSLVINLVMIHVILRLSVFAVYGTDLNLPVGG
jgi:phospholipid/cholesterol/gamma-HCH transport system permease protein